MTSSDAGTAPASPARKGGAATAAAAGRPAGARLQVALDFTMLSRALKAADEAVAGGAELIEVGTPLLKSAGLDAVRQLKARFPGVPIVADTKTMDAGRLEMEMAAKAGASFATVLGAATSGTIRECVEAGRNYGIAIIVDLVNAPDPVAAARSAELLGAAAVNVHCGIDQQMLGQDPFETLARVRQAVGLLLFVAGGINSETAATAARAGADVVVVGGAITKAPDAAGGKDPFIMQVDGKGGLFAKMNEGPLPAHYEPVESPTTTSAPTFLANAARSGFDSTAITKPAPRRRAIIVAHSPTGPWAKTATVPPGGMLAFSAPAKPVVIMSVVYKACSSLNAFGVGARL
jgi:3-hexulose-6-phosphate synthase